MASTINASTSAGIVQTADLSGQLQLQTANTTALTIDSSQNVGVGTTSPSTKLEVNGQRIRINNATDPGLELAVASVVKGYLFYDTTNNLVTVRHASGTGANMDSSGHLLINRTSWNGGANNAGLQIKTTSTSSATFAITVNDSNDSNIFNLRCDGSTYNTTGVWGTISDARLKENVIDATPKLNNILDLKVRNFNFISDENKTKQIGFVAQEIEQVFPALVSEDPEGNKSVKTTVLVPMLVKAIQEQQALIESLTTRLTALENK